MNFKIIEGDYSIYDLEDEFATLYNNPQITTESIRKQLNLSHNGLKTLRKHCLEKGTITPRNKHYQKRSKKYEPSYIYPEKGRPYFKIVRKRKHYCYTKSYKHAEKIVEKLKKCGWDKSKVKEIKKRVENDELQSN